MSDEELEREIFGSDSELSEQESDGTPHPSEYCNAFRHAHPSFHCVSKHLQEMRSSAAHQLAASLTRPANRAMISMNNGMRRRERNALSGRGMRGRDVLCKGRGNESLSLSNRI